MMTPELAPARMPIKLALVPTNALVTPRVSILAVESISPNIPREWLLPGVRLMNRLSMTKPLPRKVVANNWSRLAEVEVLPMGSQPMPAL